MSVDPVEYLEGEENESIHVNGERDDSEKGFKAAQDKEDEGFANTTTVPHAANKFQGNKKRNALPREKSIQADSSEQVNGDSVHESFSYDGSIFPSPVAITKEEALRETSHFGRQGRRYPYSNQGSLDESYEDLRQNLPNTGLATEHNPDNQGHMGYGVLRSSSRRETEKPPRLQKQLSRDRLLSNKLSSVVDPNTTTSGTQSKESSTECLDSMGVDVHEFLVKALQSNQRDRTILLKLEHDMIKFVNNKPVDFMRFPDMTSYHRMLVHRVAAYFGMDHNIDAKGKAVIINKTKQTRIPEKKFSDYILDVEESVRDEEARRRRSILKRMGHCHSLEQADMKVKHRNDWKDAKQRSFEEREVDYEKVRARIFNTSDGTQKGFSEKRNRDKKKEFIKKPWSSTDPDYTRSHTAHSTTSSLTSKASSYSGITLLSRGITTSKDHMSSSSSSSPSIHPTNDCANNGEYEHPNMFTYASAPYVTIEGQPILYPSKSMVVPSSYQSTSLQYNMKYPPQHPTISQDSSHVPSQHPPEMQPGMVSNGVGQPHLNPSMTMYPPADPMGYPYQSAPVQLVYYAPMQDTSQHYPGHVTDGQQQINGLQVGLSSLHVNGNHAFDRNTIPNTVETSNDLPASDNDCSTESSEQKNHNDSHHTSSSTPPQQSSSSPGEGISRSADEDLSPSNSEDVKDGSVKPHQEVVVNGGQPKGHPVATSSGRNRQGGPAHYSPNDSFSSAPLRPGITGQPIFSPPPPLHPHLYAGGLFPYGMIPERKMTSSSLPHPGVPMDPSQDYYLQQVPPQMPPSFPGYMQPAQPVYYVLNNGHSVPHYQPTPNHLLTSLPFAAYPVANGYTSHVIPPANQLPVYRQPYEGSAHPGLVNGDAPSNNIDPNKISETPAPSNEVYPMHVDEITSDASPELNAFAARHKAQIMKVASEDGADPQGGDIYLLFPSSKIAFTALHEVESKPDHFRISDVSDINQRHELLEHIESARRNNSDNIVTS